MVKLTLKLKALSLMLVLLGALFGKMLISYHASADLGVHAHSTLSSAASENVVASINHDVVFKAKRRCEGRVLNHVPLVLNRFGFLPPSALVSVIQTSNIEFFNPDPTLRLRPPTSPIAV